MNSILKMLQAIADCQLVERSTREQARDLQSRIVFEALPVDSRGLYHGLTR